MFARFHTTTHFYKELLRNKKNKCNIYRLYSNHKPREKQCLVSQKRVCVGDNIFQRYISESMGRFLTPRHFFAEGESINIFGYGLRRYNTLGFEDISTVSLTEVKKMLKNNGIQFDDGFACIIIKCPVCTQKDKNNSGRIYINKITGELSLL